MLACRIRNSFSRSLVASLHLRQRITLPQRRYQRRLLRHFSVTYVCLSFHLEDHRNSVVILWKWILLENRVAFNFFALFMRGVGTDTFRETD